METTYQAFHDKNDGEIEELFGAGQFPPTADLLSGDVMRRCWTFAYLDASEVVTEIQLIQDCVRCDRARQPQGSANGPCAAAYPRVHPTREPRGTLGDSE